MLEIIKFLLRARIPRVVRYLSERVMLSLKCFTHPWMKSVKLLYLCTERVIENCFVSSGQRFSLLIVQQHNWQLISEISTMYRLAGRVIKGKDKLLSRCHLSQKNSLRQSPVIAQIKSCKHISRNTKLLYYYSHKNPTNTCLGYGQVKIKATAYFIFNKCFKISFCFLEINRQVKHFW